MYVCISVCMYIGLPDPTIIDNFTLIKEKLLGFNSQKKIYAVIVLEDRGR